MQDSGAPTVDELGDGAAAAERRSRPQSASTALANSVMNDMVEDVVRTASHLPSHTSSASHQLFSSHKCFPHRQRQTSIEELVVEMVLRLAIVALR